LTDREDSADDEPPSRINIVLNGAIRNKEGSAPEGRRARSVIRHQQNIRRVEVTSSEELATANMRFDLRLRRSVAKFALRAVTTQVIVADILFIVYAWAGMGWQSRHRPSTYG
jgi:hypothetical protein